MARKNIKFIVGGILIVLSVAWLGASGFQQGKLYYKTVDELVKMGSEANGKRLKVSGNVLKGTIVQNDQAVTFTLAEKGSTITVHYVGKAVIPDSFKDDAQAVVDGTMRPDGSFEATHIQAKCASKYEAEYDTGS